MPAGFWLRLLYVLAGVVACILIVTIPFGIAAFRIKGFAVWPFGRTTVPKPTAGVGSFIDNIIWLILLGWELAHMATRVPARTHDNRHPIGCRERQAHRFSLWPLGRAVVPIEVARMRGDHRDDASTFLEKLSVTSRVTSPRRCVTSPRSGPVSPVGWWLRGSDDDRRRS